MGKVHGDTMHQRSGMASLGQQPPSSECNRTAVLWAAEGQADGERLRHRPACLVSEHLIRLCVKCPVPRSYTQELWGQENFFSKNKQGDCVSQTFLPELESLHTRSRSQEMLAAPGSPAQPSLLHPCA